MRYLGGKWQIAEWVATHLRPMARGCDRYLEPFMGSGAITARMAIAAPSMTVSDAHEDLVLMWQALALGWDPPIDVTREQYEALRHAPPSALRGFVGYGASFSGRWFNSYVPGFAQTARTSVLSVAIWLRDAEILHRDYGMHTPGPSTLVYCDPPYAETEGYVKQVGAFDSERFWTTMDAWTEAGARVVVSEGTAPAHWRPLARRTRLHKMAVAHGRMNLDPRLEVLWTR